MTFSYNPRGVCSRKIHISLDDEGTILEVRFEGGCSGNTQGWQPLSVACLPKKPLNA